MATNQNSLRAPRLVNKPLTKSLINSDATAWMKFMGRVTVHAVSEGSGGRKGDRERLNAEEGDGYGDGEAHGDADAEADVCDGGEAGGDEHEDEAGFGFVDAVVAFGHEADAEEGEVGEADDHQIPRLRLQSSPISDLYEEQTARCSHGRRLQGINQ